MDPNEALKTLRQLVIDEEYLSQGIGGIIHTNGQAIYEAFTALDNWLQKGGFLPSDWQRESPMIVVGQFPALDLMHAIAAAQKGHGVRKLRVKIEGDKVKFKVNEGIWSPPYGEIQEPY